MTGRGRAHLAAPHYESSEHELKSDGVYRYTRSHTNQVSPIDYDSVDAEAFGPSKPHLAILESLTSIFDEGLASINMANTSEGLTHQLEAYARIQAQQQEEIV